jgi:hypothetical protein
MALVLNTNSYVTIADADDYFETRIDSAAWTALDDDIKEQALVTATQLVDDSAWIGSAVSPSQALAWPRKAATYADDRLGYQITIPEDEIPARVKVAVFEQALHLVNNEDLLTGTTQTFESISIGSISLSDSNGDVTRTSVRPSVVMKPIRPLIRRGMGGLGSSWWRSN